MAVEGYIGINILEDTENLVERFESAFRSTVETYIESTPIQVLSSEIQKQEGNIEIKYEFINLSFSYEWAHGKSSSIKNEAEFGRALFEFWTKCLVETFFADELEVKTKHINISFFNISPMGTKTI